MDKLPPLPTEEGKKRYPPTGYYQEQSFEDDYPCTCKPECKDPCKGECGCEACHARDADAYLDSIRSNL